MKNYFVLLIIAIFFVSCGQVEDKESDIKAIKKALYKSAKDWSNGDLKGYMDVYWKSEELQFIGKNGITYGWEETYKKYKKDYPTSYHTGQLTFKVLATSYLASNLYSLTGEYYLKREKGEANGIFTLIFKKIDNNWVIVSDHTQ
jgi:ketosteroid isomerase-like protein